MENKGQIYAYDDDRTRLKPIFDRVKRAGVRNVQVLRGGDEAALEALGPRFDLVLVDAPCTGTGVWRRRPEAKWRLKRAKSGAAPAGAGRRCCATASRMVKPGGRIVYVTCSLLPEENRDSVAGFLAAQPRLHARPLRASRGAPASATEPPVSADGSARCAAPHAGAARHRRLFRGVLGGS